MEYVLEVLFPYLALLYAFDCITYIRAHHLLLTSVFGNKFNLKRSGLHFAGLLPTSQAIASHDIPICYTPDGIYVVFDKSYAESGMYKAKAFNFLTFQDIEVIEAEGKNIKINNNHTIKTPSSLNARFTAKFVNEIKTLEPQDRIEKIKAYLSDSFDLEEIKKIKKSNSKSISILKILSSYLFVLVFLLLPMVLYFNLSKYIDLNALVTCILLLYFIMLIVAFLTHKKMYPPDKGHRAYMLVSIIFSPVNAIHALSYLTKNLYFRFNYLAIAAYFMPRDSFKELVRREIFLIEQYENEISRSDWRIFWELKKASVQGLLEKCEISLTEILSTPEKQDQTAILYCPFCMTEYSQKRDYCIDCEVALKNINQEKRGISLDKDTGVSIPN
jgi:hypothetical protein